MFPDLVLCFALLSQKWKDMSWWTKPSKKYGRIWDKWLLKSLVVNVWNMSTALRKSHYFRSGLKEESCACGFTNSNILKIKHIFFCSNKNYWKDLNNVLDILQHVGVFLLLLSTELGLFVFCISSYLISYSEVGCQIRLIPHSRCKPRWLHD